MGIEYWDQDFGNAPAVAFSSIPPAAGNGGKVLRVSGAGIGRDIWLESNGTIWRPLNGSAVLYSRNTNPITLQNLTETTVETVGPFPGGLVKAGMRVDLRAAFRLPGLTTTARELQVMLDGAQIGFTRGVTSTLITNGELGAFVFALNDTTGPHRSSGFSGTSVSAIANGYVATAANQEADFPTVDFSQPWSFDLTLKSAAETAVTITGATWSGGVATFTTGAAHTLAVGDKTTIALVTPTDWNDTYIVTAVPDTTHFSVAKPVEPAAYTSGGTSSRISNTILDAVSVTLRG